MLYGTDFHSSYQVATVAIEAIFLFGIIAVAIGALSFKKRSQSSQALFKWYNFGLAMGMALV